MLTFKYAKSSLRLLLSQCKYYSNPTDTENKTVSEDRKDEFPTLRKAILDNDLDKIYKLDPYDLRQVQLKDYSTPENPNIVPSDNESRIIGCICETASDHINWMEIVKHEPRKCYCGNWFRVVDYTEVLNKQFSVKAYE